MYWHCIVQLKKPGLLHFRVSQFVMSLSGNGSVVVKNISSR